MSALAVSIATFVVTTLLGIIGWLGKWSIDRTLRGLEEKISEVKKDADSSKATGSTEWRDQQEKIHKLEIASVKVDGEMHLLRAQHEGILSDLKDIEAKMVTREEFRAAFKSLENNISLILQRIDGRPYVQPPRSMTPGTIPAAPRDPRRDPR